MRFASKHIWAFGAAILYLFVGVSAALALNLHKSISQYGHSSWIRENGLPANDVKVVLQTRNGYIWLGTTSGLFRFDGVDFSEVMTNPDNSRIHESISALCETEDSSLWIGTQFGGLRRLKDGRIDRYTSDNGFYDTQVNDLFETRDGRLLIGTAIGIFVFRDGKFKNVFANPNYITNLAEDSFGRIWAGTYDGVRLLDGTHFTKTQSITVADGLPNNLITFFYVDHEANVWIGTFNGLARWKNGIITTYNVVNGLSDYHINAIFEDRDGNLWVGTQRGINRLCENKWTSYNTSDGLTANNVLSFAEDREGSIWVATDNGLDQFKDVNITTLTKSEGLSDNHICGVIETADGARYFLSDQGASVTRLENDKDTVYNIPVGPAYLARDGSVWIGQSGSLFNIRKGRVIQYDAHAGLPSKWISAIAEDGKSIFMYLDHAGIFRFINGRLEPYLLADRVRFPMPQEYVTCFYQQSDNLLWVGTADSLVKVQNGKIVGFTTTDGLAGNWVSSIFDDEQGSLWISSPQGGLARYRDGKFTPYTTKIGLFNAQVFCVLGDDCGGLWLSSPEGIGYVKKQELDDYADHRIQKINSKVYSTADGMKTDECWGGWQPAGWKSKDGDIWFATRNGAVMIDPKGFKKNELPPPVLIEKVVADQKSIAAGKVTTFPPGTDKFEFHYSALSFLVPQRVMFKYKLMGYDRDWIDAGTRRAAYYTNLPPGDYQFRVVASNNDGVWNETGASFSFTLEPQFFQTYWFYVLMFVIAGGFVFGTYRLRVLQLLRREKELNVRIQDALANIKTLSGLIPICSNCKRIRDDKGYWEFLEKYIQSHSEAQFSHGICPDCVAKLYPDLLPELDKKKKK